jgi:uncharacterized protein DUF3352
MRRLLTTAAILACAALAAAGCGGDDSSGGGLESALAYVPADTPFVVVLESDVEGDQYQALDDIVGRFPGGESIKQEIVSQLEEGDENVSYEEDIRPVLGNPFVISGTDPASLIEGTGDTPFIAAVQVPDPDALDRLLEKTAPEEAGEVAGATVYGDDGASFAVEDDMVVLASTRDLLESALERADGDEHLDLETFENGLAGLPEENIARLYFNLQALIEQDPDTAAARRIEWVSALRTLGMTASVQEDSVEVEFNLKTDGGELSEEDLPLAAGDEAAQVVRIPGEIALSLRDPSQMIAFFETAFQAADPQGFGDYEAGKRAISQRFDIDVDEDVFGQLTGDLSVSVSVEGAFGARAEVADPEAFRRTIDRLAEALPQLGAGLGVTDVRRRGDLYEASLVDGGSFVFGSRGDVFVAGTDARRAGRMASLDPEEVPDARGSLVTAADAEELAVRVLDQVAPQLGLGGIFGGGLFARPLDELNGSVATSTDGMRGSFRLTLD